MRVIIITGSVATGKTTLAKKLAKRLSFFYLDVNKLIKYRGLYGSYDKKRKCFVVDIKKLNKVIIRFINDLNSIKNKFLIKKNIKGVIIDSHLSHFLPKKYVDLAIVTKCDLKVLEKRLKKRKYYKKKVRENLDCEIFDICLNEAKEMRHKVIIVETTKGLNISKISKKIIPSLSKIT